MLELYRAAGSFGSGQNWWPSDRSWLVSTDWDLSHTVIQGPRTLIKVLLDDAELETVRLEAI